MRGVATGRGSLAVRILLVLSVLTIFYGCASSSNAPEQNEKKGSVEGENNATTAGTERQETTQQHTTQRETPEQIGGCFGSEDSQQGNSSADEKGGKIVFLAYVYSSNASADYGSTGPGASVSPGASASETDTEICSINADGTGVRRLTNTPEDEGVPAWTPDGKKIAFVSDGGVYVMNADGSERRKLPWPEGPLPETSSILSRDLAWSPDGKTIAFQASSNIYVVPADGSREPRKLTTGPDWQTASSPTWSPDGKQIAFASERGTSPAAVGDPGNLYVMNVSPQANTNRWRQLTDDAKGHLGPSWSPDGKQIAFAHHAGTSDICKINLDTSKETCLPQAPGREGWPTWSPDGKQIAYYASLIPGAGLSHSAIYKMNSDGSNSTVVTNVPTQQASAPDWQPSP